MQNRMQNSVRSALLAASLFAGAQEARSQSLVKDIYPGTSAEDFGSHPEHFVAIGQTAYFAAYTLAPDTEALWKTDGTPAGTVLVKVFPRYTRIDELLAVGSTLYLAVSEGRTGELWRSDGTAVGTLLVAAFVGVYSSGVQNLAEFNGALYFSAITDPLGCELWTSDGTAQGTSLVADIHPGPRGSSPSRLVPDFYGDAYFAADDGVEGRELWQIRGSGSLSRRVIRPGGVGSHPEELTRHGAWVYFSADDGVAGREIFRVRNTAKALVADIFPGPTSSSPNRLHVAGDNLFFAANDGTRGRELWKITRAGSTQFVKDINPGGSSFPQGFLGFGGELFFTAGSGTTGRELWKSGGTAASTVLFAGDYWPMGVVPPSTLLVLGTGGVWAIATGGGQPALLASLEVSRSIALVTGGKLLFGASAPNAGDIEPWISDGTPLGTTQLAELVPPRRASSDPSELTVLGGEVYFSADSPGAGVELWKSDGTAPGTVLVADIAAGPASSRPTCLTVAGGQLFFFADDGQNGNELWVSDGTAATLVKDIRPGPFGNWSPRTLFKSGSRHVVFEADDGQSGLEPWVSDGTPGGTFMLRDIFPGGSSGVSVLARMNGLTYFFAVDPQGSGLWRTDNTPAGTVRVKGFGPSVSSGSRMTAVGNTLFFPAYGTGEGEELWSSDGTAAGTRQVTSIAPGYASSYPGQLTACSGLLFFTANDGGTSGLELWVSDGTAKGTRMLADIAPGPDSGDPFDLVVADDLVFFSAWEPTGGRELYRTDGSTVSRVADIAVGPESSQPAVRRHAPLGSSSRAIFGALGELWATDGTAPSTREVANLAADPWGSDPSDFVRIGRQIFFSAYTPNKGRELWVIDVATAGGLLVEYYGTSSLTSLGQRAIIRRVGWPTIGNAGFEAKLRFALPNAPASLLVAAARGAAPLGTGTCTLYVASPMIPLATTTGASGEVRVPLPIPNDPALVGGELFLQYLFLDPGGCFSNLVSLTHGMHVLINR